MKSNYKDYKYLKEQQHDDAEAHAEQMDQKVKDLEMPVMMFIQLADSGKPTWQTYSNQTDGNLYTMREIMAPAFSNYLLQKQTVPLSIQLTQDQKNQ